MWLLQQMTEWRTIRPRVDIRFMPVYLNCVTHSPIPLSISMGKARDASTVNIPHATHFSTAHCPVWRMRLRCIVTHFCHNIRSNDCNSAKYWTHFHPAQLVKVCGNNLANKKKLHIESEQYPSSSSHPIPIEFTMFVADMGPWAIWKLIALHIFGRDE